MDHVIAAVVTGLAAVAAGREVAWRHALNRLRQQLRAAEARSADRDQLADVGQLVSGLAQELKTPLQGVLASSEWVLASHEHDDPASEELQDLRENAARAAGIVRDMVAFTEAAVLTRRWQQLDDIVDRVVQQQEPELQTSGIEVAFVRGERLPLVYVDGRQLEKVIATMLGRIRRSASLVRQLRRDDRAAFHVTVTTGRRAAPDEALIVEIVDDGGAIEGEPDADVGNDADDIGACRRIMRAHGGSLVVTRRANGSRVLLELPVAAAPAAAQAAADEQTPGSTDPTA